MFGKGLLIGILVCVIGASALFFIDTEVAVTERVKLDKSSFYILDEIVDLEKFQEWDPRAVKDSLITVEFIGVPGIGMKAITKGKKGVFVNEYEVLNIVPLSSAKIVLRLKGGNELVYDFEVKDLERGSELTWKVNFTAPLFVSLVGVEEKIQNEFKKGFEVLKERLKSSI
jgi:hypothetical protein